MSFRYRLCSSLDWRKWLLMAAILVAASPALEALWMVVKAQLAQQLLHHAWQTALQREDAKAKQVRPWPWADHWPVARLRWLKGDVDMLVLHGGQGASLAFGPGLNRAANGGRLISAHRDTHFQFLKNLQLGDYVQLQDNNGRWQSWRVEVREIHHIEQHQLWVAEHELVLISCYPFDALAAGGPLRYVLRLSQVVARPEYI